MSKIRKALKGYGLTDNEVAIYLVCIEEEGLSPHKISKLTNIPRTTVYDTLTNLALKGLLTLEQSDGFTKQQTLVNAVNPSKLRTMIRDKKQELDNLELDILEVLPDLKKNFRKDISNTDFNFYPGADGFSKVFFTDIEYEFLWTPLISSDLSGTKKLGKFISENIQKFSTTKELIPLNNWTKHVLSVNYLKNSNYIKNRNWRYVDSTFFDPNTWIAVRNNRVAMACSNEDEVWGLVINSESLSSTLRSIFELSWITSSPITEELVQSFGENDLYKAAKRKRRVL